eukprot:scaffold976_cov161-Amphora_coffeaeformis.AAC.3
MTADIDADAPLPLEQLKRWFSPTTFSWIQKHDEDLAAWKKDNELEIAGNGADLFDNDDDSDEEHKYRVRVWCTSKTIADGVFRDAWMEEGKMVNQDEEGSVRVLFMFSTASVGYGDILWASARHVSNILADAESLRQVMTPELLNESTQQGKHPLLGLAFLELGAGAGVPSWAALRCGARVVCTDQASPDRIRSIAECAERNWREMKETGADEETITIAGKGSACALDWGGPIDEVLECLDKEKKERFDIVVAADCCYMPWLQPKLLDSIYLLMSDRGVALVPFALHGNAKDEDVMGIVDRAKERGFLVQMLEPKQLTPPNPGMEPKQALVQTLRLTKS